MLAVVTFAAGWIVVGVLGAVGYYLASDYKQGKTDQARADVRLRHGLHQESALARMAGEVDKERILGRQGAGILDAARSRMRVSGARQAGVFDPDHPTPLLDLIAQRMGTTGDGLRARLSPRKRGAHQDLLGGR